MSRRDRYDWSEVDKYLTLHYSEMTAKEIEEHFNHIFSARQLRGRAKTLGISNKQLKHKWTDEEKKYVIEYYGEIGARPIADMLGVNKMCVNKMAQELGVKYMPKDEYICTQGYKIIGKSKNRKSEHRLVMEKKLGRELLSSEIVHHIDGDKLNNDPDNLIITNRSEHIDEHRKDLISGRTHKSDSVKI